MLEAELIKRLYPEIKNPTFKKNRICLHCETHIPDQEHATRKHCPKIILDGKIRDCKSKRHTENNQQEKAKHRSMINTMKGTSERIDAMTTKKGNTVTTADLNAYDINLSEPKSFEI